MYTLIMYFEYYITLDLKGNVQFCPEVGPVDGKCCAQLEIQHLSGVPVPDTAVFTVYCAPNKDIAPSLVYSDARYSPVHCSCKDTDICALGFYLCTLHAVTALWHARTNFKFIWPFESSTNDF